MPRTLKELKISLIRMILIEFLSHSIQSISFGESPDLASLMVGAPNLSTDPRTWRHRLLRRLWNNDHHFDRDRDDDNIGDDDDCHVPQDQSYSPQVLEALRGQKDPSLCCCSPPFGSC